MFPTDVPVENWLLHARGPHRPVAARRRQVAPSAIGPGDRRRQSLERGGTEHRCGPPPAATGSAIAPLSPVRSIVAGRLRRTMPARRHGRTCVGHRPAESRQRSPTSHGQLFLDEEDRTRAAIGAELGSWCASRPQERRRALPRHRHRTFGERPTTSTLDRQGHPRPLPEAVARCPPSASRRGKPPNCACGSMPSRCSVVTSYASAKPSTIQAWIRGLQDRLAPTYVLAIVTNVSSLLSAAMDDGLIAATRAGPARRSIGSFGRAASRCHWCCLR